MMSSRVVYSVKKCVPAGCLSGCLSEQKEFTCIEGPAFVSS